MGKLIDPYRFGGGGGGAFASYEQSGTIAGTQVDDVDVNYPATVNADDILIVALGDADNDTFTVPSGWTRIQADSATGSASFDTMWKRATGSETGTETFTSAIDGGQCVWGTMFRFSGAITSGSPIEGDIQLAVGVRTTHNLAITGGSFKLKVSIFILETGSAYVADGDGDWTEEDYQTTTVGSDGTTILATSEASGSTDSSYNRVTARYGGVVNFLLTPA